MSTSYIFVFPSFSLPFVLECGFFFAHLQGNELQFTLEGQRQTFLAVFEIAFLFVRNPKIESLDAI